MKDNFMNNIQYAQTAGGDGGNKITEAIILAGGLGTRLRSIVSDLPKCMAPVNGKPFLTYVIEHLRQQSIEKFILSLGYKHEIMVKYFDSLKSQLKTQNSKLKTENSPLTIQYSIEEEPLGTGGAIKLACSMTTEKNVLVANGDTLFKIDVMKLTTFHHERNAYCTLSLKPMKNFDRYGIVELNKDYSVKNLKEKQYYEEGLINGGVYVLDAHKFLEEDLPTQFSFEKDYLEKFYMQRRMYGVVQDEYFIDIGIPEDYERAQSELATGNKQ
jgi:D-glycero-alpha-D-manno-heptose 1-phosphate guanylyltransferase